MNSITSEDWRKLFSSPENKRMKTIIALLLVGSARLIASDDMRFLEAIAQVESGGDDFAVSRTGARGRYQITAQTWYMHTDESHIGAHKRLQSQVIAIKHLKWLRKAMGYNDASTGPGYYELACAWKCGPNFYYSAETKRQYLDRVDYAKRVMNLFSVANN